MEQPKPLPSLYFPRLPISRRLLNSSLLPARHSKRDSLQRSVLSPPSTARHVPKFSLDTSRIMKENTTLDSERLQSNPRQSVRHSRDSRGTARSKVRPTPRAFFRLQLPQQQNAGQMSFENTPRNISTAQPTPRGPLAPLMSFEQRVETVKTESKKTRPKLPRPTKTLAQQTGLERKKINLAILTMRNRKGLLRNKFSVIQQKIEIEKEEKTSKKSRLEQLKNLLQGYKEKKERKNENIEAPRIVIEDTFRIETENNLLPTIFSQNNIDPKEDQKWQHLTKEERIRRAEQFARERMCLRKASRIGESLIGRSITDSQSPSRRQSRRTSKALIGNFIDHFNKIMSKESLQESTKYPSEDENSDEDDHNASLFITEAIPSQFQKKDHLDIKKEMTSIDSRSTISKQTQAISQIGEKDFSELSKRQFTLFQRLLSKSFGYDEQKQIDEENEIRKKRWKINKNKKTNVKIDDEKVDLTKFQELKTYIRDQELINDQRVEKGARIESVKEYNERKMNLYKKYFFRLINRTSDPFITARYNAYVKSLLDSVEPSFFERMEKDKNKRDEFKKIIHKLSSGLKSFKRANTLFDKSQRRTTSIENQNMAKLITVKVVGEEEDDKVDSPSP